MIQNIYDRVRVRLQGEPYENNFLVELIQAITDRVCLRCGIETEENLPKPLYSIVVDATVKAIRRQNYEGIESETVSGLKTTFIADILSEYTPEIDAWISGHPDDSTQKIVRFY